jgi:hypothetical protein
MTIPSKAAKNLKTIAVDGTSSTKSYVVLARDTAHGALLGIRLLNPGMVRVRMVRDPESPNAAKWHQGFPMLDFGKANDSRKSFMSNMKFEIPEGVVSMRQSFMKSRIGTRVYQALAELLTDKEGIEPLADLQAYGQLAQKMWLNSFPPNGNPGEQLEEALARKEYYEAQVESAIEDIDKYQKVVDEVGADDQDSPAFMITKPLFSEQTGKGSTVHDEHEVDEAMLPDFGDVTAEEDDPDE